MGNLPTRGQYDIFCATMSIMGRFGAAPKLGHLKCMIRVCGYLMKHPVDAAIPFRTESPVTPTLTMLEHRIGPTVWCMGSPREKYFLLTCRLRHQERLLCNKNDSRYLSHHVTMRISAVLHKVSY
jgi:hypothetical protein